MELAFAFIGAPVAIYLILAFLPKGWPALVGCLAAVAIAALLGLSQKGSDDSYMVALAMLGCSAIALAAFVQVLRLAIGAGRPGWVYPGIVLLALLGAGLPMMYVLGV